MTRIVAVKFIMAWYTIHADPHYNAVILQTHSSDIIRQLTHFASHVTEGLKRHGAIFMFSRLEGTVFTATSLFANNLIIIIINLHYL